MKSKPTFELLRERRELRVTYPASGARFTISLRDWRGALWGVKVIPEKRRASDAFNPYVQKHRYLARCWIEDWLERLRLA